MCTTSRTWLGLGLGLGLGFGFGLGLGHPNQPDLLLVHTHAEGHGGHHHAQLVAHEGRVHAPPLIRRAARVIEVCAPAARRQLAGHLLRLVPRVAVDYGGTAPSGGERALQQLDEARAARIGGDDLGAVRG